MVVNLKMGLFFFIPEMLTRLEIQGFQPQSSDMVYQGLPQEVGPDGGHMANPSQGVSPCGSLAETVVR